MARKLLQIMDHSGHSTVEFASDAERASARALFDKLLAGGHVAGTRRAGEHDYRHVRSFDELQDETVVRPQNTGG